MEHDHPNETPLDPEMMASLSRVPLPSAEMEQRVVRSLRAQGYLGNGNVTRTLSLRPPRPALARAAVAAGLAATFLLGLRVGESRARANVLTVAPPGPTTVAGASPGTARVRELGIAYAGALAEIRTGDQDGRAAALWTFRSAADQIVRLAPESDVAFAIGLAFPSSFAVAPSALAAAEPLQRIIWF